MANESMQAVAPATRRVRAYFAPVNRAAQQPTVFDASGIAVFNPDAPPAPWLDLGWCSGFTRRSVTKTSPLMTGAPAVAASQVRTDVDVEVSLQFESWGKLQMTLSAGVQQMNVLRVQAGAAANGSGGAAVAAVPLTAGSTATSATALDVGAVAAAGFAVGDVVAVDVDYTGQTGFVGSGVSGGYVKSLASIGADVDYVRRITLNVARVTGIAGGVLTLGSGLGSGSGLLAGVPTPGMQVSRVVGFCDREGGSFFQEWSALFALPGEQGDLVVFHYPRLQAVAGAAEIREGLVGKQANDGSLARMRLAGSFRALPVVDANDGERVVCFRSYLPAAMRAI
jgi:hypothetical protein